MPKRAQHRRLAVAHRHAVQRQDRRRHLAWLRKVEHGGRVLDHALHRRHFFQRLDTALRLARLAGGCAEAIDEGLHVRPLRLYLHRGFGLQHGLLGAYAHKLVVAAGRHVQPPLVQMGDRLHAAVQQALVMAHHQGGAGEFRQPGFQPERGFQVQMVGRLVQQQQVRVAEQHGRQRHAHAPAAGEAVHRPRLGVRVEAQAGQDGGGAGRGGVGVDGAEPFPDGGHAVRGNVPTLGLFGFGQQGEAFLVAFQHGLQQGLRAGGGGLLHLRHAGAAGELDVAAIHRQVARYRLQERGFAGAVAADQADAAAGIHGEVGAFEEGAAAHAQGDALDGKEAHGRVIVRCTRRKEARPSFLKKRSKKLLTPLSRTHPDESADSAVKSFLLLFFKKEGLPFFLRSCSKPPRASEHPAHYIQSRRTCPSRSPRKTSAASSKSVR